MRGTAFYAYPEAAPIVREAIREAVSATGRSILPWQKLRIIGFKVDDLIREKIDEVDVLFADVTFGNANVLYEIGYAIARGKPIIPTVNVGVQGAMSELKAIGLFDTTGWATYTNAEELVTCLEKWPDRAWTNRHIRSRNYGQPLFILDTLIKTDFRNHIFHTVDNAHLQYRTFDPAEIPRLTTAQAVSDASASAGAIIPILSTDIVDSQLHNLRAAFMLGLCHGYEVETLALQYENSPAPLDYRDFITNSTFRRETERHVGSFAESVLVWNQQSSLPGSRTGLGILNEIDLGSGIAENETQKLTDYFVQTAEYARAARAEGAVIIGRKGWEVRYSPTGSQLSSARSKKLCSRSAPGKSQS